MDIHKVYLFIHAIKYFAIRSWAREQPADLAYDQLLHKAKSQMTAVIEYNQDKESSQDSTAFPSASSHAVWSSDWYNRCSPSRTCGKNGLLTNSSGCCPASSAQCVHPNHWQCVGHTQTPSTSPSKRVDDWPSDRCWFSSHHREERNQ